MARDHSSPNMSQGHLTSEGHWKCHRSPYLSHQDIVQCQRESGYPNSSRLQTASKQVLRSEAVKLTSKSEPSVSMKLQAMNGVANRSLNSRSLTPSQKCALTDLSIIQDSHSSEGQRPITKPSTTVNQDQHEVVSEETNHDATQEELNGEPHCQSDIDEDYEEEKVAIGHMTRSQIRMRAQRTIELAVRTLRETPLGRQHLAENPIRVRPLVFLRTRHGRYILKLRPSGLIK